MGREIRKVPPNWQHPVKETYDPFRRETVQRKQPMYDRTFDDAAAEWKSELAKWEAGERPDYFDPADYPNGIEYWEWDSRPPDREYYRPWADADAKWFQVWETVSEGTPVTPPFATQAELIDYLVQHGDEWDQKRGNGGWNRAAAERFVAGGWAPSLIAVTGPRGGVYEPRDGQPL